ncbi:TetR family transcriptional regulator [Sphingobacterium faecium NBRC 15299]|jgi:AcrR family transcriptional regulator|uniref:TetR/AcrR family transcriptional regulator n=1 Tax=Sphingobacterium faecium TaxID=34087 RepID=UPI000D3B94A2|nr:TetR/AcrR family transcriptional regulator [Sphingobacterium faecium]PTX12097.1 TetR family transcriptional regulator [Sphingobacterium faecium]GEM63137.1 TetR family transcriptional regulator [Sphingobacterium faecium NBRC 15299]
MNVQYTQNNPKVISIFETTLRLIKDHGFHGTAMSKIAQDADVAIGTIYHYFPSKDDLIVSLFQYCGDALNESIFESIHEELTYKETFFHIWKGFVKFYRENVEMFSFFEQFYSSPYYKVNSYETNESISGQSSILKFLTEGIQRGELKNTNVEVLACIFFGTAVSAIKGVKHNKLKSNESIEDVVKIIWDGVKNK